MVQRRCEIWVASLLCLEMEVLAEDVDVEVVDVAEVGAAGAAEHLDGRAAEGAQEPRP